MSIDIVVSTSKKYKEKHIVCTYIYVEFEMSHLFFMGTNQNILYKIALKKEKPQHTINRKQNIYTCSRSCMLLAKYSD